MIAPLAIVLYEELMPGSQLVNRLQDIKYRVQAVSDASELLNSAAGAGPMLILIDLGLKRADASDVIRKLRADKSTTHIPIIGFADEGVEALQNSARAAGATLVVTDAAIIPHLQQFVDQALQVE